MKTLSIKLAVLFTALIIYTVPATAQTKLTPEEVERYSEDARKMVSYLETTFNTLGNPKVSVKEKDIIINQSWAKIFVNSKVHTLLAISNISGTFCSKPAPAPLPAIFLTGHPKLMSMISG